ncbi:MAG: deoxynucleotide monophosphate kinase [Parvibaculum sp.]|uniref:deoxynucleotide monophosphate kinase family protein n=1 Tax=Parvibaculum sp. TaxID=2024848 RepID=UPI002724FBAF|nr:deoxynucleotide monophosphate kinase [Parvibaculum sp.]MDO8839659.1 deoxynucleotide monophosphate kinase [Parvibaculum sp.]
MEPASLSYDRLIAIHAPAGSGKSEVANHLITTHGFTRVKFAGALKDMIRILMIARGCPIDLLPQYLEGTLKDVPTDYLDGSSPRRAMQTLGTEWGRAIMGYDFWLNSAVGEATRLLGQGRRVVIDDMRFMNEYHAVRTIGGQVWTVNRSAGPQALVQAHASEGALPPDLADIVIPNNFDLKCLRAEVDAALDGAGFPIERRL